MDKESFNMGNMGNLKVSNVPAVAVAIFVASLGVGLGAAPSAFAGANFSMYYAPTYSMPSTGNTGDFAYAGGGARIELMLARFIGFEVGGEYLSHSINGQTASSIMVPGGLRLWAGHFFSIEGGGYFNYYTSPLAGMTTTDYGIQGGGGFNFPLTMHVSLFLETYFHYGLANLSSTGGTLSLNELVGTAGLRFHLGH